MRLPKQTPFVDFTLQKPVLATVLFFMQFLFYIILGDVNVNQEESQ